MAMRGYFSLFIDTHNAAFADPHEDPGDEIARILRVVASDVEQGLPERWHAHLRDANGNTVGLAAYGPSLLR